MPVNPETPTTTADPSARMEAALASLAPVIAEADPSAANRARHAARILAEIDVDAPSIRAAAIVLLDEDARGAALERSDEQTRSVVEGTMRLLALEWQHLERHQTEHLRQMFLVMAKDLRTVFVALATRIPLLRDRTALDDEERHRLALATREVFAPLAGRLGIWHLKWQLEDLAMRELEPDVYQRVKAFLAEKRSDRSRYLEGVVEQLSQALADAGIRAKVYGRPKHIASIVKKMRRKNVPLEEIYDMLAVRVIVDDVPACYAALGVVHGLWEPIPGEFDDYIARPKGNDYRSLHTAVRGPKGRAVEIQIRTWEMHERAEYGVAAHWRYKEGGAFRKKALADKIDWLRRLLEWRDEGGSDDLAEALRSDVFRDQVYVLTPAGEIVDLPEGATCVDFAYRIHTEVGHRCRGAKVNGRIVPLNTPLETGDRVEILTGKHPSPSRDWLNPDLGYVKTASARQKIRQFFRAVDRDQAIEDGRALVARECERLAITDPPLEDIALDLGYDEVEGLYAAVGFGDVRPGQVGARLLEATRTEPAPIPAVSESPRRRKRSEGVVVGGIDGVLGHPARCCSPVPGDDVVGYVTRGRGLSIHRRDCPNLAHREPERIVEVDWRPKEATRHTIHLRLECIDRPGVLRDVLDAVVREGARLPQARGESVADGTAVIELTVDVRSAADATRLLDRLERLPYVLHAVRIAQPAGH